LTEVKLRDFDIFFYAEYTSEIRFAISTKRSEKQTHLKCKKFVVGRFIGAERQTTRNKKLIHPSVLWQIQGIREEKTWFCTQKALSVRLVLFLAKVGGPR